MWKGKNVKDEPRSFWVLQISTSFTSNASLGVVEQNCDIPDFGVDFGEAETSSELSTPTSNRRVRCIPVQKENCGSI